MSAAQRRWRRPSLWRSRSPASVYFVSDLSTGTVDAHLPASAAMGCHHYEPRVHLLRDNTARGCGVDYLCELAIRATWTMFRPLQSEDLPTQRCVRLTFERASVAAAFPTHRRSWQRLTPQNGRMLSHIGVAHSRKDFL